jgi:glycosyltransferase involved in cell wall biosynthesis
VIFLYYDGWDAPGGIATYMHALATHLHHEKIPFRVVISELTPSPMADELEAKGIQIYRQPKMPGDRWLMRKHLMLAWLESHLKPGDWVFSVCQPHPALYLKLVRLVHRRRAKIGVSWMVTPEFWPLLPHIVGPYAEATRRAIAQTDAVISASKCSVHQFKTFYGYTGKVHVVPLHNLPFFDKALPLPIGPPWKIGFMGRLDIQQKNLDTAFKAFAKLRQSRQDVELHLYGGGKDRESLEKIAIDLGLADSIFFHGAYDHRHDLKKVISDCHFFIYPSRFEGGPCFSLLELTQAGRYCVAANVGGIPDLYAGRPDVGLLMDCNDAESICQGLRQALEKLENGLIDGDTIRARYFDGFDIMSVHQTWTAVMNQVLRTDSSTRKTQSPKVHHMGLSKFLRRVPAKQEPG